MGSKSFVFFLLTGAWEQRKLEEQSCKQRGKPLADTSRDPSQGLCVSVPGCRSHGRHRGGLVLPLPAVHRPAGSRHICVSIRTLPCQLWRGQATVWTLSQALSQGHGAGILAPPPSCDWAGDRMATSGFVSWMYRAVLRPLGQAGLGIQRFSDFRKDHSAVCSDAPSGVWAASQNQTHRISTEKHEIFLKTIISLASIQVRFLPQN